MEKVESLALVGAGSLGQSFAGLLAASGQRVTLLGTPRTIGALLAAGRLRQRRRCRDRWG
jgi:ketopantoate reductase